MTITPWASEVKQYKGQEEDIHREDGEVREESQASGVRR
jgi:hypothetical protein